MLSDSEEIQSKCRESSKEGKSGQGIREEFLEESILTKSFKDGLDFGKHRRKRTPNVGLSQEWIGDVNVGPVYKFKVFSLTRT